MVIATLDSTAHTHTPECLSLTATAHTKTSFLTLLCNTFFLAFGLILVIFHVEAITLKCVIGVLGLGSSDKGDVPQMVGKKNTDGQKNVEQKYCSFFFFLQRKAKLFPFLIFRLCLTKQTPDRCLLCSAVTVCECLREAVCVLLVALLLTV
ncbi:Hypothetical predicted protein [Xyrichtys novacula]|uniref:Uncharacterized protein n=1 Tax=Xyrichtys novacula TaxID=13765 RepID=A0AAV1GQD2_XYRNO|nr:Hypothetical predicted protein [Xyrichtys novacula]